MAAGIYEILNTVNGKRYIGQSVDIDRRWKEHRKTLRKGIARHAYLQAAWNKYGEAAFKFSILVMCEKNRDALFLYEQQAFNALKPEYNLAPIAGSNLGVKHRPEVCAAISARMKGKTYAKGTRRTPEQCQNISESLIGKKRGPQTPEHLANRKAAGCGKLIGFKHPPEFGAAISARQTGKKLPEEWSKNIAKGKIGNTVWRGRKHKPESKAKIADTLSGVKHSPERREANRLGHIGLKQSPETIAKRVAALTGQKRSAQQCKNISLGKLKNAPVCQSVATKRRKVYA